MGITWHPIMFHTIENRETTIDAANMAVARFAKVNGKTPQLITRDTEPLRDINKYWYPLWVWDYVPEDVDYVLCMDSKVLAVSPLPELPELEFAASMDRHDRVLHGMHYSDFLRETEHVYQPQVFIAHRSTRPAFEELKLLVDLPEYNTPDVRGQDGRAYFVPFNETIQQHCTNIYDLPKEWNWNIGYEKEFYTESPYLINFVAHGTWAYFRYIYMLLERIDTLEGAV